MITCQGAKSARVKNFLRILKKLNCALNKVKLTLLIGKMKHKTLSQTTFLTARSLLLQLVSTHQGQEGYIEELSTCFYLDTALLKSSSITFTGCLLM